MAAVALGNTPGHDQAQAETGLFAADERLKQARQEGRSNARTGITNPQFDLVVHRSAEADVQATALGHCIQGVQGQVDQQLLYLVGIGLDDDRGSGRGKV